MSPFVSRILVALILLPIVLDGSTHALSDLAEDFARLAEESLVRQREIESADTVPFEVYRQQYLDPGRLSV